MLDNGSNIIGNLLSSLTGGLTDQIAASGQGNFTGGPLGEITGVLDRFGLDFTSLIDEFLLYYEKFRDDIAAMDSELSLIVDLKPKSFARFPEILQLGSKKPSDQYSAELKELLWNKLVKTFDSPMFNGVKVPELSIGKTFIEEYPSATDFPVERFLPHIAIAYGRAVSFSDPNAISFTMPDLFAPSFDISLTQTLLEVLKSKSFPDISFDRFNRESVSGQPMDSDSEVFVVGDYLPHLQFALDLAPSVDFHAPNFKLADLYESLNDNPRFPTVKSMGIFVKKRIIEGIISALDGLFDVPLDIGTGGLSVGEASISGDGFYIGNYSASSTKLFPATVDIDKVQVSVRSNSFGVMINVPFLHL